jgi:mRNA-degrading endonuclease RelE of RelBE toxin-antitoxin system
MRRSRSPSGACSRIGARRSGSRRGRFSTSSPPTTSSLRRARERAGRRALPSRRIRPPGPSDSTPRSPWPRGDFAKRRSGVRLVRRTPGSVARSSGRRCRGPSGKPGLASRRHSRSRHGRGTKLARLGRSWLAPGASSSHSAPPMPSPRRSAPAARHVTWLERSARSSREWSGSGNGSGNWKRRSSGRAGRARTRPPRRALSGRLRSSTRRRGTRSRPLFPVYTREFYDSLEGWDRRIQRAAFKQAHLLALDHRHPSLRALPLEGLPGYYRVRVATDVRLIYRRPERQNTVELLSLIDREDLDRYIRQAKTRG